MAASWQDHVHLMTSAPIDAETTGEWTVLAKNLKPTGLPESSVIAAPRRALDGTLRAHVLQSAGTPVLFVDYTPVLKIDDEATRLVLEGLLGTTLYYVPAFHDPAAHTAYDGQVFFDRMSIPESPGPTVPYMVIAVHLMDAE
jgi:hypothetical protein